MDSDFRPLLQVNVIFTCADYTNVVPEHNGVSSAVEILHIKHLGNSTGLAIYTVSHKQVAQLPQRDRASP